MWTSMIKFISTASKVPAGMENKMKKSALNETLPALSTRGVSLQETSLAGSP